MRRDDVAIAIQEYLRRQLPNRRVSIGLDTPLLDGTLDSLALVGLIAFVQRQYRLRIAATDVTPANFGSAAALGLFVESSMAADAGTHASRS